MVRNMNAAEEQVYNAFRRWGYLQALIDPFGLLTPEQVSELDAQGAAAAQARKYYCGSIGAEFMHLTDTDQREWIQVRMERESPPVYQREILERLVRADVLEQILHAKYPGTKRFSLEGVDALIPLLDEILEIAVSAGMTEAIMGMSHRGRLNVMVQVVGKHPSEIFAGFEDVDPRSVLGGGDVKYHMGATGVYRAGNGGTITVRLSSNPSHLEAIDPVVLGRAKAKQIRAGEQGTSQILPLLIHGDAAIAGIGLGLDLTLRDLQNELKKKGHPWEVAKAFDGAAPLSGFLRPGGIDLDDIRFRLSVNGEVRQSGNTRDFIFPLDVIIRYISQVMTLEPGDLIATGTPKGVGPVHAGDVIEVSVEGVGVLKNPVGDEA